MNTKVKQANYNQDVVDAIVSDYTKSVKADGSNNAEVLDNLSKKHGKSIPSLRAKLAQLKVYLKPTGNDNDTKSRTKKLDLLAELESLVGCELPSLDSATKSDLQSLIQAFNA